MALTTDIAVIGAGPAGSAAAITLARGGCKVVLVERGSFPRHKVCGEFVSGEALPLLRTLLGGSAPILDGAPRVDRTRIFSGTRVREFPLVVPAGALTRSDLDAALWQTAANAGANCRGKNAVVRVSRGDDAFAIETSSGENISAKRVIDATGRWSRLRNAEAPDAKWIGLKAHFLCSEQSTSCDLHFFRDGYCGVLPIGRGMVNAAAMVRADRAHAISDVLQLHPALAVRSREWKLASEPLAVAPLFFRQPAPIYDGMLCVGDAAGFIDPFVGSGISLALHSGVAAAEALLTCRSANEATAHYTAWYEETVRPSIGFAAKLRLLMLRQGTLELAVRWLPDALLANQFVSATRPRIPSSSALETA